MGRIHNNDFPLHQKKMAGKITFFGATTKIQYCFTNRHVIVTFKVKKILSS